jgi:5-methylthioadenosine/S-adenosylhomocysteine deaminase
MPAQTVWQLATEGGARALKLDNVGRLAPGWQADLQLIELDSLPTPPAEHNLYEQLLLQRNRSHVRATLVAGQPRVQAGQVLGADMAALIAHTREAATRLWKI